LERISVLQPAFITLAGTPMVNVEGFGEHKSAIGRRASNPMITTLRLTLVEKPRSTHKEYKAIVKNTEGLSKVPSLGRLKVHPEITVTNRLLFPIHCKLY
jgi:hypothetical protein